jgi:hypothetical protein
MQWLYMQTRPQTQTLIHSYAIQPASNSRDPIKFNQKIHKTIEFDKWNFTNSVQYIYLFLVHFFFCLLFVFLSCVLYVVFAQLPPHLQHQLLINEERMKKETYGRKKIFYIKEERRSTHTRTYHKRTLDVNKNLQVDFCKWHSQCLYKHTPNK